MPSLTTFHLSVHPFLAPPGNLIFTFFDKSFDPSPIPRNPNSMSWIVNLVRVLAIERYVALLSVRFTRKLRRMPIKR